MNEPKLKPGNIAYNTRHALTRGIVKVELLRESADGWFYAGHRHGAAKQGGDYHATIEAAQERTREMARRKLAALDKQRAVIEAILRDGAKVTA